MLHIDLPGVSMTTRTRISRIVTHAGKFHADEVYAIALLYVASALNGPYKQMKIDSKLDCCEIRRNVDADRISADTVNIDIGGGLYDHHGEPDPSKEYSDGLKMASVGLIWRAVKKVYLATVEPETVEFIEQNIVRPIDLNDTTGAPNMLATFVDSFNGDVTNAEAQDKMFDYVLTTVTRQIWALCFASFQRIMRIEYIQKNTVVLHFADQVRRVILCSFRAEADEISKVYPSAVACIYKHERGDYVLRSLNRSTQRPWLAPKRLWGLRDNLELVQYGATFVHPNGFIMGFHTADDAVKFLNFEFHED